MATLSIIGMGNVGANLASTIVSNNSIDKLLINTRTKKKQHSYKIDLEDLSTIHQIPPVIKECDSIEETLESDLAIMCVRADFENKNVKDIRLAGMLPNAELIKHIAEKFDGYKGKVIMVTNPVDIMSRLFYEQSGLEPNQVYGVGSNLCSQRYRFILSEIYKVPIQKVEGQVIGEHGDSRVILFSSTRIDGIEQKLDEEKISKKIDQRSPLINAGAGRTKYGPIGVIIKTIKKAAGYENGVEQLSSCHNGVYIGLPVQFNGGNPVVNFPLMDSAENLNFGQSLSKLSSKYMELADSGIIKPR